MWDDLASLTTLPNLHPAIVHFPVALVFTALAVEAASLASKRRVWLERGAALLYALASASAGVAYLAGRRAADAVGGLPAQVEAVLADHSDLALWTLIVLAVAAIARVAASAADRDRAVSRIGPLRVVGMLAVLVAATLIARTADLGGSLVYRYGVAVAHADAQVVAEPEGEMPPDEPAPPPADQQLQISEDGSLVWEPRANDASPLGSILQPATGATLEAVHTLPAGPGQQGVRLQISGATVLCLPKILGDVAIESVVDLSGFKGTVGLGHHIGSIEDGVYFTVASSGRAALAIRSGGSVEQLNDASLEGQPGKTTLATSVAGRHLKGLVDGQVVVHGHASSGDPGKVGILVDGHGEIGIERITVTPVKHP